MKTYKIWKKFCMFLLCLVLGVNTFMTTALAYGPIDLTKKSTLTIQYEWAKVEFRIYRVADVTERAEYKLVEPFDKYSISMVQKDQDGWRSVAQTLKDYIFRDVIPPLYRVKTDENGCIKLTDMEPGVYLVVGNNTGEGDFLRFPSPYLVMLPSPDGNDNWSTDVKTTVKYTSRPKNPRHGTVERRVIKIWDDGGDTSQRPSKIEVQLLRDGKVWKTVSLSAQNNWKWRWQGLSSLHEWQIVEKEVPEDYEVSIERDGENGKVVITNKLVKIPETTPADEPTVPSEEETPPETDEKLPQTGIIWWPVGALASVGMIMLLAGWVQRKREHEEE